MKSLKEDKANEFAKTVQERGHEIINGLYVNNNSVFEIHCLKHKKNHKVIAGNYKRSRFGIPCCASAKQSAVKINKPHPLKGRIISLEVRAKISKALKGKPKNYPVWLKGQKGPDHPAYKHGKGGNRKYDHSLHAAWIQGVKRASNFKCFITGKDHDLECHHLIGFQHEPTRYLIENGVAICKKIHKAFHAKYGVGYSTPDQFEEFCRENYNITEFPWRQGNHKPSLSLIEEQEKILKMSRQKANEFAKTVQERGHEIIDGLYVNNNSVFEIHCLKHKKNYKVIAGNYKRSRFGIPCCASAKQSAVVGEANRHRKAKQNEKANKFAKIVQKRGHQIADGFYATNNSLLTIHCLKHGEKHVVKAGNYKIAYFGVPCCASEKESIASKKANHKKKR